MLRKRTRSHQKDQQNMGQGDNMITDSYTNNNNNDSCYANSDAFLKQKHQTNSFFTVPGLFVGLNPKISESDSVRSPTSPLDFKVFSKPNFGNCNGNGLSKDEIMEMFFYGLTKSSQKDLDLAGSGNFLYKTTNSAYKMMEDMVQASLARDMDDKDRDRRPRKTVAIIESSSDNEVIHELKVLSNRFSTFEDRLDVMHKDLKVIAHGCNNCGGMHYTEDCEEE